VCVWREREDISVLSIFRILTLCFRIRDICPNADVLTKCRVQGASYILFALLQQPVYVSSTLLT